MPLLISEGREVYNAYAIVHDFFDAFGFAGAKTEVERLLTAALKTGVCRKSTPSMILFRTQKLCDLTNAAFVIYNHRSRNEAAILLEHGMPDISQSQNYMPSHCKNEQWEYFPRHLSAAQYHDPYKAIHKFCNYLSEHQWVQVLKDVTEYALSEGFIETEESGWTYNLFTMKKRLLQLIEACWLIELRINNDELRMPRLF